MKKKKRNLVEVYDTDDNDWSWDSGNIIETFHSSEEMRAVFDFLHNEDALLEIITRHPRLIQYIENPSIPLQKIAVNAGYKHKIKNPHISIKLMEL